MLKHMQKQRYEHHFNLINKQVDTKAEYRIEYKNSVAILEFPGKNAKNSSMNLLYKWSTALRKQQKEIPDINYYVLVQSTTSLMHKKKIKS